MTGIHLPCEYAAERQDGFCLQRLQWAVANHPSYGQYYPPDKLGILGNPISHVFHFNNTVSLSSNELGWTAASKYFGNASFQKCTLKYYSPFRASLILLESIELYMYSIPKNQKGVWPLGQNGLIDPSKDAEALLPGMPMNFVAFGLVAGRFYGGMMDTIPVNGQTYTIPMLEINPATFKSYVDTL